MSLKETLAFHFLKETNLSLETLFKREKPLPPTSPFKEYPLAPKFPLKIKEFPCTESLFSILAKRRSKRNYRRIPFTSEEIALLCWAVQGVTARSGPYYLRTAPSAGALYPIETYLVINYAVELTPGLYHLNVREFSLELCKEGFFGNLLRELTLGQYFFASASVVFLWTAVLRRTLAKYDERGLRYIFLDCAHICQNLLLACEALGMKACPVGAFFDEEINTFLEIDGEEETILYLATVGK